jgi:excisionase family DNA binding protein
MNSSRAEYFVDRIRQARTNGETDTTLGKMLKRWNGIDIPVGKDGRWLLEGFIMEFKKQREILNAIDPTISPDLPPHLLDPAQIAHFFGIPLEEVMHWPGIKPRDDASVTLERINAKLDILIEGSEQEAVEFVSIRQAARLTGLSSSHVRRAVVSGELPASNVGSAARPTYRISRTDMEDWMNRKRGGTTSVPPRSERRKLIDRHLPGVL